MGCFSGEPSAINVARSVREEGNRKGQMKYLAGALLHFNKAIGVSMERLADGLLVQIGAQDWIDKAVVAINPHTALGALLGAVDQNKMVFQIMDALDRLAQEQQPGVEWSTAPRGV